MEPYASALTTAPAWAVDWAVDIGGQDMTSGFSRVLQTISVTDQAGQTSDSCELQLDDSYGQIRLPSKRAPVLVRLNGALVFRGFVEKVQSAGSRSAGRTLTVSAKGMDTGGKAKEPQSFHLDDADLGSFLGRLAENAGLSIRVDPDLAKYKQDYWAADGESFIAMGERLAQKFGGTFKIRGNQAVLARRGGKTGPGGQVLAITEAVFGENLISWTITPREPRRQFAGGRAQWFDRASASIKTADLDFGNEDHPAINILRPMMADESEADATLDAQKRQGEFEGGTGSVSLNITPGAAVEGQCLVKGTRPGVDGAYVISSVKHSASRSGGATTALELKQPGGGAGSDTREAGSSFALTRHETLG